MPLKWKVLAVYSSPFWREEGYCGAGSGHLRVLEQTADSGPPEGKLGIIASFVLGNKVGRFNQLSEQKKRN